MKTKTLSLSLAALMSAQSIGLANTDRTEGIGQKAVLSAQENLTVLKAKVLSLDQSLESAAKSIEARDQRGGLTNGLAVASAGLGIGLSAMAYLNVTKGSAGSGLSGMLFGVLSIGASVNSMIMGKTSKTIKTTADTKALEAQLAATQQNINSALIQAKDKASLNALAQLSLSLKNTQDSLSEYQDQESDVARNRLVSQASQLVGVTMVVFAISNKSVERILPLGLLAMNGGNLGAMISGFQGSKAEEVLKEIQQTRQALRAAAASL